MWWFCASPLPVKVTAVLFFICRLVLLNPPLLSKPWVHMHSVQPPYSTWPTLAANHNKNNSVPPLSYTRDELLAHRHSKFNLDPCLISHLRSMDIGLNLPRRRSCRGGTRKQRKIPVLIGQPFTPARSDPWTADRDVTQPRFDQHTPANHAGTPPIIDTCRGVNKRNLHRITLQKVDSATAGNIKVASFNAQSLGPCCRDKRTAVNDFITEHDIDIFLIQETWFTDKGDKGKVKELAPVGYTAKSFPRENHGGGLAIVYKDTLLPYMNIKNTFSFTHTSFECFQVTLSLPSCTLHLWNIYRTFPSRKNKLKDNDFLQEFPDLLSLSNQNSGATIFFGDINFHFDQKELSNTSEMLEILDTFDLSQAVLEPTQKKGHVLDWVIFRRSDNVLLKSDVTQELSSDHFCVVSELNIPVPIKTAKIVEKRNIKGIDRDAFRSELREKVSPVTCRTAEELHCTLSSMLDTHAPLTCCKVRPNKCAPWYSDPSVRDQVIQAKKERRYAEKHWLKSGLTVGKEIYTAAKKRVIKLIDSFKTAFNVSKVQNCKNSSELYKLCNSLAGKENKIPLPNTHSIQDLPEIFNDFFSKKIADIRSELDRLASAASSAVGSDEALSSSSFSVFRSVTVEDVKKIILKSKPTSCPLDPIPTPLLVECLDDLLPTITHIINSSILSGSCPVSFKSAIVKPLLKKPTLDPNILKNFRPVSNLSFLSKILEKVVLQQLFDYLHTHSLLSPNQSAYRPAHSTETALLRVTNDILTALDRGDVTFLTLLDLSAAFDTIDHFLLYHILSHNYGISGTALTWFKNYLTDRTQSVNINNTTSSSTPLSFGVPQGSVLGPILFIMYTQPLHALIQRNSLSDQAFADDTQLYQSCNPKHTDQALQTMQACISDVKSWMTDHKLKLNDDKTEALLIHTRHSFTRTPKPSSLLVCSSDIPFSSSARNLGFILSDDMTVDAHITHISRSAYAALRQISSIRHNLTLHATVTLICSLVLSRLDYCNSLLINAPKEQIKKLQKIQNSAARLALKIKKSDHITPALKQLHWLPIEARIIYKVCLHCHNFFTDNSPAYISDLLSVYQPSRALRSSDDHFTLTIPRMSKQIGERAFSYAAPTHWNSLPRHIRQQTSTPAFKRTLKTHLFKIYYP